MDGLGGCDYNALVLRYVMGPSVDLKKWNNSNSSLPINMCIDLWIKIIFSPNIGGGWILTLAHQLP